MFDPQVWGSWFELTLPRNPVFVDSRIELFPTRVWSDYDAVSAASQDWQEILNRWHVAVLVAYRRQQGPLIPVIRKDSGWRLVYEDAQGLVFVRA